MHILNSVRGSVSGAINFVVDKNRRLSIINKVKHVIRDEEQRANEAYIALGKYYYHNLRNAENNETEFYCAEVLAELTQCQSEIYNFDDEAFEEFCRACEETGCDGCEGCRPIEQVEDWMDDEFLAEEQEVSSMDVELPPQVQEAMDSQKKDAE